MSLGEFEIPTFENSVRRLDHPSQYLIKKAKFKADGYESLQKSMKSCTLYIGKLSTDTTEEQLYELFVKCGIIKQIIMGLDRFKNTPCGFCFIIYQDLKSALSAMKYLNHTMLDGAKIEIDLDPGFVEGRQFGRGADGGQFKKDQYLSRGGYHHNGRGGSYRGNGYRGGFRGSSRGPSSGFHRPQRSGVFPQDRRRLTDTYVSSAGSSSDYPPRDFDRPASNQGHIPPRRILEPRSGTLTAPEPLKKREGILERPPRRDHERDHDVDLELPPHLVRDSQDNDDPMLDDELPPHLR